MAVRGVCVRILGFLLVLLLHACQRPQPQPRPCPHKQAAGLVAGVGLVAGAGLVVGADSTGGGTPVGRTPPTRRLSPLSFPGGTILLPGAAGAAVAVSSAAVGGGVEDEAGEADEAGREAVDPPVDPRTRPLRLRLCRRRSCLRRSRRQ